MPQQWQNHKDLPRFIEEANLRIRQQVDPKTHDDTNNPHLASDLSEFELSDDEKKEQLYITYYFPLDIQNVPFGNRQVYLTRALKAVSDAYIAALDYLPAFTTKEIPKLVKTREKRVQTKPPGKLHTFFKSFSGTSHQDCMWLPPDIGTEPDTHIVSGMIHLEDKDYGYLGTHQDWGNNYAHIMCQIYFPLDIQEALNKRLDTQTVVSVLGRTFGEYIETNKLQQTMELFQIPNSRQALAIGVSQYTGEKIPIYGWDLEIPPYQVMQLVKAHISQEQILTKYLQSVRALHKHLYFFARLNYDLGKK